MTKSQNQRYIDTFSPYIDPTTVAYLHQIAPNGARVGLVEELDKVHLGIRWKDKTGWERTLIEPNEVYDRRNGSIEELIENVVGITTLLTHEMVAEMFEKEQL